MKRSPIRFSLLFSLFVSTLISVQAQTPQSSPAATRPRTVTTAPQQTREDTSEAAQTEQPASVRPQMTVVPQSAPSTSAPVAQGTQPLSISKFRARLAEAERLLKARAVPTAMTPFSLQTVTLAVFDPSNSQILLLPLPKTVFLKKNSQMAAPSSAGSMLQVRILRANGVNTAVTVTDATGRHLIPLVVEYPIERGGRFHEMAYYTSAHPALLSPEVVKTGESYVRTMLDLAAKRLRDKGVTIQPALIDMAERLCIVEHVDHLRFRTENRRTLYEEIFALYALNELDTYRYSVSWAGAGGMVQMIPSTYQMMRRAYPGIGLNPDFVYGMRNHGNALEAMLLYIKDTWSLLSTNSEVIAALRSGIATQPDLLAAGYNSNPAKLPGYIRRGGSAWRTLIPRETQIYLQIYASLDSLIPMKKR